MSFYPLPPLKSMPKSVVPPSLNLKHIYCSIKKAEFANKNKQLIK